MYIYKARLLRWRCTTFFCEASYNFRSLRHGIISPENGFDYKRNRTATLEETFHGLGIHQQQRKMLGNTMFPTVFDQGQPHHSETVLEKNKMLPLIVARVISRYINF